MFNQYTYRAMGAVNRQMEELGNRVEDLGNIFTPGYRGQKNTFHETMQGVKAYHRRDQNTGMPAKTDGELDFAIEGVGFFEVELPDGSRAYTRNGAFTVGPNGELLSSQGYPVVSSSINVKEATKAYDDFGTGNRKVFDVGTSISSITIPAGSSVNLSDDGVLQSSDGKTLGKLSIVTFTSVDGLHDIGDNLFVATERAGNLQELDVGNFEGQTKIKQGYIEQSNVSVVNTMADAVQLNTAIKAEMKIIKLLDQMQESLNSTITKNI